MTKRAGVVTLPDGRSFRASATYGQQERDTGGISLISIEIEDMDGNLLEPEVFNQGVAWPYREDGKLYLWEAVEELVWRLPGEEEEG